MKKYRVKMTPLEPYSFGTDQGFLYPGEVETGKESYFVTSQDLPEQTTVLGMLRYLVLRESGLLKTDFSYDAEERNRLEQSIGPKSFSFLETDDLEFGYISKISPVVLLKEVEGERDQVLIPNPFHNVSEECYMPITMQSGIETSYGMISLPERNGYDAKKGHAEGFYNLQTGKVEKNIFQECVTVGNRKDGGMEGDGFFKREQKLLGKEFCFAVYAEAEGLPQKSIAYMGMKKSAFCIETTEISEEEFDIAETVRRHFEDKPDVWYYALSDIYLKETVIYEDFCMVEEKQQRNLETVYDEAKQRFNRRKTPVRFHLIRRGSVFYHKCPVGVENTNCMKIGYNVVVKLGGKGGIN